MSGALSPEQAALLSAALRHARDAETLLALARPDRSPDQAWHLGGFAPECARKATLDQRAFDKAIGHGVTTASELALSFALAHDPAARRYGLDGVRERFPVLAWWSVDHRYLATGTVAEDVAAQLVAAARSVVDELMAQLYVEGRVPGDFSW